MYFLTGGCLDLFHSALKFSTLAIAITLGGIVAAVANPGPGNRLGTEEYLAAVQAKVIAANPSVAVKAAEARMAFDKLGPVQPTEEQVRYVLGIVADCTDLRVKDVLSDPDERREAAWLLYLDTYSRHGPKSAALLFVGHSPPVAVSRK